MRHFGVAALTLILVLILSACSRPGEAPRQVADTVLDERARSFVGHMVGGRYPDAVKMMETRMAAALPADKTKQTWESLVAEMGTFGSAVGTRSSAESGYRCVYVTCEFRDGTIDVKVVFDAEGKVTGLWFLPSQAASAGYKEPAYALTSAFTETECTVGEGDWRLPATLTLPKGGGPFPGVVLVHGSGPQDRDETIGPNKPFKDLAWGLASRGIAVLRYEKRTRHYPSEVASSPADLTVKEETVDDAFAAVSLLSRTKGVDPKRVYILGHSLGASLAPRIVLMSDGDSSATVAGLIMMAPNARSIVELVVEQTEYLALLDGKIDDEEAAEMQRLRLDAAKIREGKVQSGEVVLGGSKAYWDDLASYDPLAAAKALEIPILLLQGERDYQVTMEEFALWRDALAASGAATLKSFPQLNHLFMAGEGRSSPHEYLRGSNVDGAVVEVIAAWLKGR